MATVEILDPKNYFDDDLLVELNKVRTYSLLPDQRIGWNYPLDYLFVLTEFEKFLSVHNGPRRALKIVDIGCGPGAIHGYLEDIFDVDIIGIDMHRWERDYVTVLGDFCSSKVRNRHDLENLDLIISSSAFEHNRPSGHLKLVAECRKALNPENGRLITTPAVCDGRTHHYSKSSQWNLSFSDVRLIYGHKPENSDNYSEIYERWQSSEMLVDGYMKRFPDQETFAPSFLSLGYSGKSSELDPKRGLGFQWIL